MVTPCLSLPCFCACHGSCPAANVMLAAPGSATSAIVQLLQKLYFLRQPLLSRHATAALTAVCSSPRMDAGTLSQLLASLLDNSSAWEGRDSDTALSLAALLQSGLTRSELLPCFLPASPTSIKADLPVQTGSRVTSNRSSGSLCDVGHAATGHLFMAVDVTATGSTTKQSRVEPATCMLPTLCVLAWQAARLGAQRLLAPALPRSPRPAAPAGIRPGGGQAGSSPQPHLHHHHLPGRRQHRRCRQRLGCRPPQAEAPRRSGRDSSHCRGPGAGVSVRVAPCATRCALAPPLSLCATGCLSHWS